jgi:hypothetical protein
MRHALVVTATFCKAQLQKQLLLSPAVAAYQQQHPHGTLLSLQAHLVDDEPCAAALCGVLGQQAGPWQVVDELVADQRLIQAAG